MPLIRTPHPAHSKVDAYAPASMANIGPGFDILGCAFADPKDRVIAEPSDTPGVTITAITGDGGKLTLDPTKNTAGVAATFVLKQIGAEVGVKLTVHKGLPLASGLGSSSASAVAGAVAVNGLFGAPLRTAQLLEACVEGEAAVSGRHADNVGPALFGGIVLVTGITPESVYPLPVPPGIYFALITPDVAVPTIEARAVLPKQIPLSTMVAQTGSVARLVAAICREDINLLALAMEEDFVIEPARAHLMPGLREMREAAADVGGLATVISGAGPTLCTLCDSIEVAAEVTRAAAAVYERIGLGYSARVTTIGGGAGYSAY